MTQTPPHVSPSTSPSTLPIEQSIVDHTHDQRRKEGMTQSPLHGNPFTSSSTSTAEQRAPEHMHDQRQMEVMMQIPLHGSPSTSLIGQRTPEHMHEQGRKELMTPPHGCPSTPYVKQRTPEHAHDQRRNEVIDQTLLPGSPSTSSSTSSIEQRIPEHMRDHGRNEIMTKSPQTCCRESMEQRSFDEIQVEEAKDVMAQSSHSMEPLEPSAPEKTHDQGRMENMTQTLQPLNKSMDLTQHRMLQQTKEEGWHDSISQLPHTWNKSMELKEQRTLDMAQDEKWHKGITQVPQPEFKYTNAMEQRTLEQTQYEGWHNAIEQSPQPPGASAYIMEQDMEEQTIDEGWFEDMTQDPQTSHNSIETVEQRTLEQTQNVGCQEGITQTPLPVNKSTKPVEETQNEERKSAITDTSHPCCPCNETHEPRTLKDTQAEDKKCNKEEHGSSRHMPVSRQSETLLPRDVPLLERTPSFGKSVKFLLPAITIDDTGPKEDELRFFQGVEKMLGFKENNLKSLFTSTKWTDLTEDKLLRKQVLKEGLGKATKPLPGQEVTVQLLGIREDGTLVEKDPKLVFILDEGDVIQALELCVQSMQLGEECFLLTDALYAFGLLGRDPDIPTDASLLYDVTLLRIQDRPSLGALTAADCISLGNQKRECGNFHFEREEYRSAMRSYNRALSILESPDAASLSPEETEELCEHRIKCLNNIAATQLKLHLFEQVLASCDAVLELNMDNVKALYRKGKLLSERGDHEEAMNILKRALKLEPTTKAIHAELSKLVRRRKGLPETPNITSRPKTRALLKIRGDLNPLLPRHTSTWKRIPPWTMILGAVVAVASIVVAVLLTQDRG